MIICIYSYSVFNASLLYLLTRLISDGWGQAKIWFQWTVDLWTDNKKEMDSLSATDLLHRAAVFSFVSTT